ncbi:putative calcium-binding protein [Apostasia shenzhenica]|uniref:Putative calcium-binding protein n=1 Tax=Apostasia shenzhenica TaxID=1088818 RepID=A0A2H9ZTF1_9ASPA|nr:putative calcium-binding protein [Apostasia shenzhenica]
MQKEELNEAIGEGTISSRRQRLWQNKSKKADSRRASKALGYGAAMMSAADQCVSCTTFNILAPIYKRLDEEDQSRRESQHRGYWLNRNQGIIDRLLVERSSIICLQEVWLGNDELVEMYEKRLGDSGYTSVKLPRTNNRGDGLLTAIRRDCFRILNYRELLFSDFGDRVAQLLHVESVVPFWQSRSCYIQQEILIVNTHLLFPHDYTLCIVRLHQVYKILQYVESYLREHKLKPIPVILCGDWNGSKRGHVYKFLRSQGFVSSYDVAHQYSDSDADAHKWVSHRNHRGNICGVDFIWLLNPSKCQKPLRTSWIEAVFGITKVHLLYQASLTEENAFAFFKGDSPGDYITCAGFCQALCQLGLTGHPHGLCAKEIEDLWVQADIDGNGVVDCGEFEQRIWNPTRLEKPQQLSKEESESSNGEGGESPAFGFDVKNAALFPPEVEKGMWPENYSLSDHAPLTVVFSPVSIPCTQSIR